MVDEAHLAPREVPRGAVASTTRNDFEERPTKLACWACKAHMPPQDRCAPDGALQSSLRELQDRRRVNSSTWLQRRAGQVAQVGAPLQLQVTGPTP